MVALTSLATLFALRLLALTVAPASPVGAVPVDQNTPQQNAGSSYWMSTIKRQGTVPFGKSDFKVFRNVKDYGAKGDGSADDTDSINKAITDGNRCGKGCDSQTTTPALVYFPPVSSFPSLRFSFCRYSLRFRSEHFR